MKYIIIVADGMADQPLDELEGKTPLEIARTPHMDAMAALSTIGEANFVPAGMAPGSDVANLSIFGYDPRRYYTGRGPLEAEYLGVELGEGDVAFRCNFITEANGRLVDYSAGHITTAEAAVLIEALNAGIADSAVRFYAGVSYRHLLVVRGNKAEELLKLRCAPPHDIQGQRIDEYVPDNKHYSFIRNIMQLAQDIVRRHEVNGVRIDLGENPANAIWLWGQGRKTKLPSFYEKHRLCGGVISAVALIKGIAKTIGLHVLDVPGITGYYDTNYEGKGTVALKSLTDADFVFIHIEAPDEAGHNGDTRAKITAIENIDRYIVGPVFSYIQEHRAARCLIVPDHPTPVSLRTHTAEPVCFLAYGDGIPPNNRLYYNEKTAHDSGIYYKDGYEMIDTFFLK